MAPRSHGGSRNEFDGWQVGTSGCWNTFVEFCFHPFLGTGVFST
ncbi:unnamed protein product, partial [Ectocarpus fasciculatus]